jgi:hypothetical protein
MSSHHTRHSAEISKLFAWHSTTRKFLINIPQADWNPGPEPARLLEIIAPAGFEHYFVQLAALLNNNVPRDDEAIEKLASEYGLTYHMEQLPALIAKYGLKAPGS